MALNELTRYNAAIFDKLQSKCERGTRFGKFANLLFFVLFRVIGVLKRARHWNQTYGIGSLRRFLKPEPVAVQVDHAPSAPWHLPISAGQWQLADTRRALIVAELSIPQCKRYRVDQKAEALKSLGWHVEVLSFTDEHACLRSLPFAGFVLFYRTPYWPPVKRLIDECKRLSIPSIFDIDDLVFDVAEYRKHPILASMNQKERDSFLKGAESYGACLSACDHAIASTELLASWMRKYSRGQVFVIENAFDGISIQIKHFADSRPPKIGETVAIGYGSGTRSHDHDFQLVSGALIKLFQEFPSIKLIIHGYLNLGEEFAPFSSRIVHIPFLPADVYLQSVAAFDINLAPLETSIFNDAKSNIKFIEAALVGVPTVASPTRTFASSIEHAVNGFLAGTVDEWYDCLKKLVESPRLRRQIGSVAQSRAWEHYRPEVTERKMSALISAIRRTETMKPLKSSAQPRILAVNVFFAPFSFGGATVLLEQLMETLPGNLDRAVFTCNQLPELPEYALFKYEEKGSLVYSCKVEGLTLDKHDVSHPTLAEVFKAVLAEYRPDIVHFHSTQGMGIELISLAKGFGARVVVTSHDAWWICARQFMMKADKTWCGQQQIDLKICASCTGEPGPTFKRFQVLSRTLEQADVILTPSSYQRGILVQNLPASLRIEVNKNGIVHPHTLQELRVRAPGERIRFGFLGGLGAEHKGYDLVMDVFRNLNRDNFELRLVDLGQKLGHLPAKLPDDLRMKDKVVLVPPFSASDAANFYSQMDVLIAPSKIPESFGMAAREALLYGCHVIVSRLGGVVEDLDGRPGVHFLEDVSKEALHKVVAGMLAQGLPRHSQGPAKRFTSPEEQARELLAIYQSLA